MLEHKLTLEQVYNADETETYDDDDRDPPQNSENVVSTV